MSARDPAALAPGQSAGMPGANAAATSVATASTDLALAPGVAVGPCALAGEWCWLETLAGAAQGPAELAPDAPWLPAPVPGTVAAAMRAAGRWDDSAPPPLHRHDYWYRVRFAGSGARTLRCNGLATLAEVWLNGELVLTTRHMFAAHQVSVQLAGDNTLHLCFRALHPWLRTQRGHSRWKPRMIVPPTLRAVRTTLLGHMPGWCPPVHAVGPWRSIELLDPASADPLHGVRAEASTQLDGTDGIIALALHFPGPAPAQARWLAAHGGSEVWGSLARTSEHVLAGTLRVPHARRWWPHTHGEPALYRVEARLGKQALHCAQVGFRTVEQDRDGEPGAFALRVNGERIFCRGACVSSHDLPGLADSDEAVGRWLRLARDAGMNMVRVGGVTCYPGEAFYRTCDALGLLVWQDFMFANFDYGADLQASRGLMDDAAREVGQWLQSTRAHPAIAVLCGGSEAEQQAAMLGTPRGDWRQPLFDELIPGLVARHRADVVYVRNSPSAGAWPFQPDTGVTHYYGVGAYQRPLADARLASVRFAAECLAFANVPCARTLREHGLNQPLHDPRWKARVPRDAGAAWDFEDIRDFYLRALYRVDPPRLRYERPARYLALSRAVVAELMTEVFSEWRRVGSTCAGGLVWMLQDLLPGAGWGIVDACGRPKSPWHALRAVWQPLQVLLTDEGLNGLHVHVINETAQPRTVRLTLRCLRDGEAVAAQAQQVLTLHPRESCRIAAAAMLDRFFDFTYAYRFGPPAHDVVLATLHADDDSAGAPLSQAVYLPDRSAAALAAPELRGSVECVQGQWWLHVGTRRFARWVHIEDHAFLPEQDWFHLGPGETRRIRLMHESGPAAPAGAIPSGEIYAINADRPASYDASAA
ncbi:glycoside hydrolase family 2 protein [Cupriavidus sp. WGtm5]|uniref:glycosyl hydrolase 2 galactose-binding domain-containing protein n=1 Tax=Cupriavidus sp. WGtm5 TaxID=2919926 RepID=UPI0020913ED4|nr:glycoside hydrolase family 2 protein [Cupriavidus sp. WGtm5]MCO4892565.1 glycoside hydrolase family 2 protein [Cupriavidus sp. WGtm5]